MTAMPAARMGLEERGIIAEGMLADIVIFNPDTISGQSTFTDPHQYAVGIEYVFVNGQPVLEQAAMTGVRPGAVLRHKPEQSD